MGGPVIKNIKTERYQHEGLWFWAVTRQLIDDATGETTHNIHVFPEDAITIRAAEYGLDLTDPQQAIDFLLHEPLIEDPPKVAHLFTKASTAEALAAHQADVDAARARYGHGPMPKARAQRDVHIAAIANQVRIDPEAYQLARAQSRRQRDDIVSRAAAPASQTEAPPLAERLRARERKS